MTNYPPADTPQDRLVALRRDEKACMTAILSICPAGRERCIAQTKLEEAFMWARQAVESETKEAA